MTHDIPKNKIPRNFFADWTQREREQHAASASMLSVLKDASALAGLLAFQSKPARPQDR